MIRWICCSKCLMLHNCCRYKALRKNEGLPSWVHFQVSDAHYDGTYAVQTVHARCMMSTIARLSVFDLCV